MTILLSLFLAMFTSTLMAAPCPTKFVGSCESSSQGMIGCLDLVDKTVPVDQFKAQCKSQQGKFAITACKKTKLVGSCIVPFGQLDGMITRFYQPMTLEMANTICKGMAGKACQ